MDSSPAGHPAAADHKEGVGQMATKRKTKKAEEAPKPKAEPEAAAAKVERPTINTRRNKVEAGRDFTGLEYPIHLEHEAWTVEAEEGKRVPRGVTANDAGELEGFLRVGYRVQS